MCNINWLLYLILSKKLEEKIIIINVDVANDLVHFGPFQSSLVYYVHLVHFNPILSTSIHSVYFNSFQSSSIYLVHFFHFGLLQSKSVHFGPIQFISVQFGILRSTLVYFSLIQSISAYFGSLQLILVHSVYFSPFGLLQSISMHLLKNWKRQARVESTYSISKFYIKNIDDKK